MPVVYDCRSSTEEDRPWIDFEADETRRNNWLRVGEVVDGELPVSSFPLQVSVVVRHPEAVEWDCYFDGGSRGLFSQRFVDAVGLNDLRYFSLLPCTLNGAPYFFLRCERTVDCLDRGNSGFTTFPHNPSKIMHIKHFAFVDGRVPADALFCIPETRRLLATESVVRKIRDAGLKGVRTPELP